MTTFAENIIVSSVTDGAEISKPDAFEYQNVQEKEYDFDSHIHLIMKALDYEQAQIQAIRS
ncbi:MAG: hypothetical protein H6581_08825 [Bacteroidia bacterium]|nr:hypothetical protein [Bacteroidia bacterium]